MASLLLPLDRVILASGQAERRVSEATRKARRLGKLGITWELWSIYRHLKDVLKEHQFLAETYSHRELDLPVLRADFLSLAESTELLRRALERLILTVKSSPLSNWSLIGSALDALKGLSGQVLDYADLWELSTDPDLSERVARAEMDLERGNTFTLGDLAKP